METIDKTSIALSSIGRYQAGNEIYKKIQEQGYKRSLINWNKKLALANDYDNARIIFKQIKGTDLNPDEVTYTTLMNKVVDFEQAKEVLREMKDTGIVPDLFTLSTLFTKDIGEYTAREVHIWYVKEEKYHPSGPIEGLIKNLFLKSRLIDVYYLILHYPHLTISKKIVKENFREAISIYNKFRKENFYDEHIDYALGIAYFDQQKYQKAKKHLENALNKSTIVKQKKDIEELLAIIANNT